jgi:hypothetical protein
MKKYISILLVLICSTVLLWSCEKDLALIDPVATTDGLAFIKIVDAAPNFRAKFNGADSFNIYVNGAKVNGSQLTYNSVFPAVANLYAGVPAGAQTVRVTVNGKLTPDSTTLLTLTKTLAAGSYYTFVLTDEAMGTNEARQMWIKDNFALTDTNNFTLRFVDAVLNDPTPVDVYSYKKATNIFSNISPATATAFVSLPYTLIADTLYVRTAGTQTEIARINIVNGSTTAANRGRAYTLLYKGQFGNATKPRSLSFFGNN